MWECRYCGGRDGFHRERGVHGIEILIFLLLFLCLVVPGIIYYVIMDSKPVCDHCGARARRRRR